MRLVTLRTAAITFAVASSIALLLLVARETATAQVRTPPPAAAGTFTVTPLDDGGWLVHDTRTGSMEHWKPQPRGYLVHQLGFGEPHARARMVYPVN